MYLELEYLGELNLQRSLSIEETGKGCITIHGLKDLAHMWITEPLVTGQRFCKLRIEYLIENTEIIQYSLYTESDDVSETVSSIPEWVKNNAEWWAVEVKNF